MLSDCDFFLLCGLGRFLLVMSFANGGNGNGSDGDEVATCLIGVDLGLGGMGWDEKCM